MSLVYKFPFPLSAVGADIAITDRAGTEVDTGTLDLSMVEDGRVVFRSTLDEGAYSASGIDTPGVGTVIGDLDEPRSITAGGGVGAAETAYFVSTGPSDVSDGGGNVGNLTFVADDRHGALPDWAAIDGGDIALSDDAGTIAWSLVGTYDYDFSGTTPQGSGGNLSNGLDAHLDGVTITVGSGNIPGDGEDEQTGPTARGGGVDAFSAISCQGFPGADDVTDGTATPRVALTVTRIAQAAVLPDA